MRWGERFTLLFLPRVLYLINPNSALGVPRWAGHLAYWEKHQNQQHAQAELAHEHAMFNGGFRVPPHCVPCGSAERAFQLDPAVVGRTGNQTRAGGGLGGG